MPTQTLYSKGHPATLTALANDEAPPHPDLAIGLCALLRSAGMNISYCEADVLCGQATQFVYSDSDDDESEISFLPPVETLFKSLGVTWKEVTPSDPAAAFRVIKEWIQSGSLVLARLKEPLIVYGYACGKFDDQVIAECASSLRGELRLDSPTLARDHWRFPFDEANQLLCIESAPGTVQDLNHLCHVVSHRAVRAWRMHGLASCASGRRAYETFATGLSRNHAGSDSSEVIRRQYFHKLSAAHFFERVAPRFGGGERNAFARAGFCYSQCGEGWKRVAQLFDLNLHRITPAARPKSLKSCNDAIEILMAACDWEHKATNELLRVIG